MHWRSTCRTASARAPDLSPEETVEQSDRVGKLGNGGHKRRRGKWIRLRSCSPDYAHVLGEGSIPVPLPPPACPRSSVLWATSLAIRPSSRSRFRFELRTPVRQNRPIILWKARFSLNLWTSPRRYGSRNSIVSNYLLALGESGSAVSVG